MRHEVLLASQAAVAIGGMADVARATLFGSD
jgi:hypothetical protein